MKGLALHAAKCSSFAHLPEVSQTSDRAMHFARVCFAPRALAPWAGRAQAHRTSRAPPREAQGRQAEVAKRGAGDSFCNRTTTILGVHLVFIYIVEPICSKLFFVGTEFCFNSLRSLLKRHQVGV